MTAPANKLDTISKISDGRTVALGCIKVGLLCLVCNRDCSLTERLGQIGDHRNRRTYREWHQGVTKQIIEHCDDGRGERDRNLITHSQESYLTTIAVLITHLKGESLGISHTKHFWPLDDQLQVRVLVEKHEVCVGMSLFETRWDLTQQTYEMIFQALSEHSITIATLGWQTSGGHRLDGWGGQQ